MRLLLDQNLFPHLLATLALRRYARDTATAALFYVPVPLLLIDRALTEGYIDLTTFAWAGLPVVAMVAAAISLLFALTNELPDAEPRPTT